MIASEPQRADIREVARAAKVSTSTVSNVLNNPGVVAPATRRKVEQAIRELRYVPNASARHLRVGAASAYGAIVYDLANPYYTELIRGIEDGLADEDALLIVCSSDDDVEREARQLSLLRNQGVSAVFVTPTDDKLVAARNFQDQGTPIVLLARERESVPFSTVHVDDVAGAGLAVDHLLDLGHRRIAFINGPTAIEACVDRSNGARGAIAERGLEVEEALLELNVSLPNADAGEAVLETILAHPRRPTAVFCVNDLVALGVLRGMRTRGLAAPDDLAVVGYDDVEFAGMLSTPLSSVRQPKYQVGRAAADLMLNLREDDAGSRHVLFHPELIVRESSRTTRRRSTRLL